MGGDGGGAEQETEVQEAGFEFPALASPLSFPHLRSI